MIILFGPTGVGKTDLSQLIAHNLPVEIINMDMGSFYTPLTIGTAKPDWQHQSVRHHLFDIINQPNYYTVAEYRNDVLRVSAEIRSRGAIPLVVGGSAFYLASLFFPPREGTVSETDFHPSGPESDWWHQLAQIDPERARAIHPHDHYRIKRALAVWHTTGKRPSELAPVYQPVDERVVLIHLTRDRADLFARINARVAQMMQAGWIDEVARLRGTAWDAFIKEKKIIGYDDILVYLEHQNGITREELIEIIAAKTRRYAKRQEMFWNKLVRDLQHVPPSSAPVIQSVNLTLTDVELYIKQLLKTIS